MVAKAPRKNIAAGRSNGTAPYSGGGSGKKKGKVGGCGNPLKVWPIPKGQKGLQSFFGGCSSSNDEAGGPSCSVGGDELERLERGGPSDNCEEVEQLVEGGSSDSCDEVEHLEEEEACDSCSSGSMQLDDITQVDSDVSDAN